MTSIKPIPLLGIVLATGLAIAYGSAPAADEKPNIVVIMGDDVGWFNTPAKFRSARA